MGLRVAILSRIITFVHKSSTKNGKMFRSASSSSKGKMYGSSRLHPYAQQLPIVPPRDIMQPIQTRAAVHRVLGYRSPGHGERKSMSPRRRRQPTTQMSVLSLDGTYDDEMRDVPMQSIEPIPSAETGYGQDQQIKREDSPYPHSISSSTMPNIKDESLGPDYSYPVYKYNSDLSLPLPIEWTGYDDISKEQRKRLDHHPVECLDIAAIGTPQRREQVRALLSPRVCIDSDANVVDRFVTDCSASSGRVYDRLFNREVPRIIPYAGNSRPISGQIYDLYTGEIRKRCLFDDLRDRNSRTGPLEVTEEERDLDYDAVPDYDSSESADASSPEEDNVDPCDYDANRY
jgi:hypothetical protein